MLAHAARVVRTHLLDPWTPARLLCMPGLHPQALVAAKALSLPLA